MLTLLLIAPLPPPIGGATRNIELFLTETAKIEGVDVVVVNTSPGDYRKGTHFLRLDTVTRFLRIIRGVWQHIGRCEAVLLFGRPSFIFSLGSIVLLLNRWYQKPVFIKPFGGDFHLRLERHRLRRWLLKLLQTADHLFPETQEMTSRLQQLGLPNVSKIPNFRLKSTLPPAFTRVREEKGQPLKLLFISQIKAEKGIFVLLESLQKLAAAAEIQFKCDIYGPIFAEDRPHFETQLQATPQTTYRGILEFAEILPTMSRYDLFLFPSYHENEGHPGVILEAMQVGLPVISTEFRSIGELITSGENGLLVPIQNSAALAEAIKTLATDHELREQMGRHNYARREAFEATTVIQEMMAKIGAAKQK